MQSKFLSPFLTLLLLFLLVDSSHSMNLYNKASKSQDFEEFSFSAIYIQYDSPFDMFDPDPNVTLFRTDYLGDFKIKKMVINGKEVKDPSNYYYFEKLFEKYYISFVIDISRSTSLKRMFYYIDELEEIKFTNKFDTSNIETMEEMFYLAEELKSVDFGDINTKNLKSIKRLFAQDERLTKVNFGKMDTSKVTTTDGMFYLCSRIEKIDISKLD